MPGTAAKCSSMAGSTGPRIAEASTAKHTQNSRISAWNSRGVLGVGHGVSVWQPLLCRAPPILLRRIVGGAPGPVKSCFAMCPISPARGLPCGARPHGQTLTCAPLADAAQRAARPRIRPPDASHREIRFLPVKGCALTFSERRRPDTRGWPHTHNDGDKPCASRSSPPQASLIASGPCPPPSSAWPWAALPRCLHRRRRPLPHPQRRRS